MLFFHFFNSLSPLLAPLSRVKKNPRCKRRRRREVTKEKLESLWNRRDGAPKEKTLSFFLSVCQAEKSFFSLRRPSDRAHFSFFFSALHLQEGEKHFFPSLSLAPRSPPPQWRRSGRHGCLAPSWRPGGTASSRISAVRMNRKSGVSLQGSSKGALKRSRLMRKPRVARGALP